MDTFNTPQDNETPASESNTPAAEPSYVQVAHTPAPYAGNHAVEKKPGKTRAALAGLVLSGTLMMGMLLGGAGAGAVMLVAGNSSTSTLPAQIATAASTTSAAGATGSVTLVSQVDQATINSIYKAVSPSVVKISGVVQSSNGRFSTTGEATGTGIVVDTQGDILTNFHVIDGASSLKVQFADGKEYTATVVGTAQQDDLAVIKVAATGETLVPAQLGDSSTLQVGDEVITIGYPYALDQSVSAGIVSGLNRDGASSDGTRTLTGLIQVDAAINPGNSGGPLLNAKGEVIGINTMIDSPVDGFTGVGLSIPVNQVKSVLSQLTGGAQVQRPWIGISGTEITASMQQQYNLPVSKGILVINVTASSPAAQAGLQGSTVSSGMGAMGQMGQMGQMSQAGDIITAIDGQQVGSVAGLTSYLNSKQPGDKVTLTIVRDGQQQTVTLTLQAWSASGTGSNS